MRFLAVPASRSRNASSNARCSCWYAARRCGVMLFFFNSPHSLRSRILSINLNTLITKLLWVASAIF